MADAVPSTMDREARKAAEKVAKAAKAAEKAARQAQRAASQMQKGAEVLGPSVTLLDWEGHNFGNLFIQSHAAPPRAWTEVPSLEPSLKGREVWVRARMATSRKQGKTLCFMQLRSGMCTVQAVVYAKEGDLVGFAAAVPRESIVDIYGEISVPDAPVESCTQRGVELQVQRLFVVSRAMGELPLQLEDACRNDDELSAADAAAGAVRVNQDTRLNNRVIDLRTPANQSIMRMQHGVCQLFREFLISQGFTEIHTPKLIGTASEGGADVFAVDYFGRKAYLAQSPQLYKQMALMADLERVFEVAPVFRSENSLTHRHMCEFVGLDLEMCFHEHYSEVLDMLDRTFNAVFDGLNSQYASEQAAVTAQHPCPPLRYKYPCLKFTYKEAMELLRVKGSAKLRQMLAAATHQHERAKLEERIASVSSHGELDDIGTEDEKLLGLVIGEEYGQDFYIIDKFPTAVRPFYTMADPVDPRYSNSYDIFIRGEEVTSGAQRIHDPEMLYASAAAKEPPVDLSPIQSYVDAFKYGAFPHAGGGVGLERVVMLFLGLPNIRKTSMFPRDPKRLTP